MSKYNVKLRLTKLSPVPVCLSAVFRSLAEMAAATSLHVIAIIDPIIQHADWFFPEGKASLLLYFQPYVSLSYLKGIK